MSIRTKSFIAPAACIAVVAGMPMAGAQVGPGVLEEIVVTAQKREQSLQEVPISISVVPGDKLLEQGFNDLQDVTNFMPGVIVEESLSSTIRIRGIDNQSPNVAFEQATAIFNDGIYYGRPMQSVAGIYDVQQVEVLFGPQPVYFGQSAIAGLIGYNSTRPAYGDADDTGGYLVGEVGSLGHYKVEGAAGGALGDDWGFRVAGRFTENDGWMTDFTTGRDSNAQTDSALRLSVAGQASDSVSIYAKYETFEQDSQGSATADIACDLSVAIPVATCGISENLGLAVYGYGLTSNRGAAETAHNKLPAPPISAGLDLSTLDVAQYDQIGNDVTGSAGVFEIEAELANGAILTSTTGFSEYDSIAFQDGDASAIASLIFPNDEAFDMVSQELRLASDNDGPFNWMAGVYYQNHELDFQFDIISSLPNPMGVSGTNATHYAEDAEYSSVFGSLNYDLSSQWSLDYGLRYQTVAKNGMLEEPHSYLLDASGNEILTYGPAPPPLQAMGIQTTAHPMFPNGTQAASWSGVVVGVPNEQVPGYAPARCIGPAVGDACPSGVASMAPLEIDDDNLDHQFSLRWRPTDEMSAFVRYVTGYKAGGFSRGSSSYIVSTHGIYDAEKAQSVEIGGKWTLLEDRLRINATLFNTNYDDRQVNSAFADPETGATFFIFVNAAESTIRGLEADASYISDNGLTFRFAAATLDALYDSFENGQCTARETAEMNRAIMAAGFVSQLPGRPPGPDGRNPGIIGIEGPTGCKVIALGPSGVKNLSGTEFDGQPNWSMNFSLGRDFTAGNLLVRLNADYALYADFDETRPDSNFDWRTQEGFGVLNLRGSIGSPEGTWDLALYGRNVTDELYWLNQPGDINIFGTASAQVSRPATYGLTYRYNF